MTVTGSDCKTGKRQFATKRDADETVKALHTRGWATLRSYRCRICKCWHTGNQFPKMSGKRRRRK